MKTTYRIEELGNNGWYNASCESTDIVQGITNRRHAIATAKRYSKDNGINVRVVKVNSPNVLIIFPI